MASCCPPKFAGSLIAADPDAAGRKAARKAWARWTSGGREVHVAQLNVAVDFNELLTSETANAG